MARLIGQKLLTLIPVLLAVSLLTYLLLNLLPGDPALLVLGPQSVSAESIAAVRAELGLDRPLPVRYLAWLGDALTGDLGQSYITRQEVTGAILDRLPVTLELMVVSLVLALALAIPLGVFSAYRAGSRFDKAVTGTTFGLLALPNFIFALLLIFFLSVRFDLFPATGWQPLSEGLGENLTSAFLPALALSVTNIAVFTRLLRTDMITTLQEDHVTLARSKGLPTWRILFRHALRPSSFSLLTVAGLQVGTLLSATVIVETIFALPGVGRLLFDAINSRDLLMVQGVVLVLAVSFVLVNFVVDLLYTFLDPRIRSGAARVRA
ncbi:ABC transporter permease [Blastococcus saxobsidens]|uniref:Putative peptide transport system permease n=1 Tax=Blastococcus saxobsidens (strain DD2) TaxID=1146883 RepID=H6RKU1_BLASD|nr:ABC transporter permease [Blastococcus saxobsidens]CCG03707.1 putative peptide transport system permease [Blastococcus saxobsidens DD2]